MAEISGAGESPPKRIMVMNTDRTMYVGPGVSVNVVATLTKKVGYTDAGRATDLAVHASLEKTSRNSPAKEMRRRLFCSPVDPMPGTSEVIPEEWNNMKRAYVWLVATATVLMFAVSPVAAATSQGLLWGVAKTNQFNFTFDAVNVDEDISLHEGIYMNVTDTPPSIPNVVTDWAQVPVVDIDVMWTNGTTIGLYGVLFLGLALFGGHLAVPIGNWTLMTEVVQTSALWNHSTTFTTNSAYWGMALAYTPVGQRITIEASYLKSDGFLAEYTWHITNATSSTETLNLKIIREGLPNDLIVMLQDNILLIGIGVGVVVILGAVVCMKRK
ncbi:MAG: hypothetical protein C4K49_06220 [Candidatus Thorarchaeota archaeon]|nr:MAG: hypothetical protein C4K49_06220 [Candidatus Thorarchaeota archaeon]